MIHLRLEIHLRRFERVIRREVNRDEEQSALVRRVARSDDRRVPVENIIVRPRARAAGRRRVLLQICSRRACASSVIRARANALSYRSKREDVGQPETRRRRRRRAARAFRARARRAARCGILRRIFSRARAPRDGVARVPGRVGVGPRRPRDSATIFTTRARVARRRLARASATSKRTQKFFNDSLRRHVDRWSARGA